jgi:hypothetical protein
MMDDGVKEKQRTTTCGSRSSPRVDVEAVEAADARTEVGA